MQQTSMYCQGLEDYNGICLVVTWISNYCPDAKYILKADDDMFANTFHIFHICGALEKTGTDTKGLLLCLVHQDTWKLTL